MKVSFVVPAYNEEAGVERSLRAILDEIKRVGADAEVVLVNNASTDRTREIASAIIGVRVVDELRKGLVRARNAGHHATTGELVAHVDSDTRIPRGWLTTVLREFEANPKLVALSGPYIYDDLAGWQRGMVKLFYGVGYLFHLMNQYFFKKGAMLQGGNFVLRRNAWDSVGGFDTSIEFYGEDTNIACRLVPVGEVKWSWELPAYTSGRRFKKEGFFRIGVRYAINHFSVLHAKRPHTETHEDVRS